MNKPVSDPKLQPVAEAFEIMEKHMRFIWTGRSVTNLTQVGKSAVFDPAEPFLKKHGATIQVRSPQTLRQMVVGLARSLFGNS
jgi:hypothetical protein